jgi:protein SDA1
MTITTLKDANKQKHKSPSLSRTVQTLLFSFVGNTPQQGSTSLGSTSSTPSGVWAVRITSEMWRKGIWNDARSVELMKEAACSDVFINVAHADVDSSSCDGRGPIFPRAG